MTDEEIEVMHICKYCDRLVRIAYLESDQAMKSCLNCKNKNCYVVSLPEEKKKDCKEHHENYDWDISFDCKNHNKWKEEEDGKR